LSVVPYKCPDESRITAALGALPSWYDTTCCPPNLERILASLPGYIYSTSPQGVCQSVPHLRAGLAAENGIGIRIAQQTEYPLKGALDFTVDPGDDGTGFVSDFQPDLLGGVLLLKHRGTVVDRPFSSEPLYRPFREQFERPGRVVALTFIPYYARANREPSRMEFWSLMYRSGPNDRGASET
jgi:DUF1680 family protein